MDQEGMTITVESVAIAATMKWGCFMQGIVVFEGAFVNEKRSIPLAEEGFELLDFLHQAGPVIALEALGDHLP